MSTLNEKDKFSILALRGEGYSQKELARKFKVSQGTISKLLKKSLKTGSVDRVFGSGRPSKLTPEIKKTILRINDENSKK